MLFPLVALIGYLVGTALHTLIATLVTVRKRKRPSERIFLILVIAVGLWHAGNLVALIMQGFSAEHWKVLAHSAKLVAFLGLATFPALLLHTHLVFLRETEERPARLSEKILIVVAYLPLAGFAFPLFRAILNSSHSPLEILAPYMLPFVSWFVVSMAISAIIDMRLARIQQDEPFRHFYRVIGILFLFITLLTTFSYILGGREFPELRKYLEFISIFSSILPSTILAYFIYRYNFLELVIRRSFFVITLTVVIFGIYFVGVRQISNLLADYFNIVPGLFEAISILVLVVTFPIYKGWLQRKVNQVFFREFGYYHQLFTELEQTINRIFGLQQLADYIQRTVSKILFLESVHLTIFELKDGQMTCLATTFPSIPPIEAIVSKIEKENAKLLRMEDVKEEAVTAEMKTLGASMIIPVRHKGMLMGVFSFKAKPPRRPILTQELEMLQSLAAQTGMSAASALLMEDKLKLEREVAAKERLASIGQMAATLAHEIKNPLSAIKSITQALQEQVTEEGVRQDLDVIVHEVDRLNHSVNQLLQFARSSAQDVTDVSPVLVMERVIKVLQTEFRAQNVQIHHQYSGSIPSIYASHFGLQDIFLNLLLNALQEMTAGGEIRVEYEVEGSKVRILVSDSGPGIRPDLMSRIFDPFFTTKQKGTGLGLAVVKQKVAEFGGDIEVVNLKPNGCQFRVTFPLEKHQPVLS